jgi:aconitate hydratase
VFLKDIWPSDKEVADTVLKSIDAKMFRQSYDGVFAGDKNWSSITVPKGNSYAWDPKSTYVKNPPYFDGMTMTPGAVTDIHGARALAVLGDSVTTVARVCSMNPEQPHEPGSNFAMERQARTTSPRRPEVAKRFPPSAG